MDLTDEDRAFLGRNHAAAMITLKADGTPHAARVGIGLVGNKVWSSGTKSRVRTRHLRRDPRCTLFVFDPKEAWQWLALETTVTILDGPDAPELNLALYRVLAGEPGNLDEYLRAMVAEERLIYEFEVQRAYGAR